MKIVQSFWTKPFLQPAGFLIDSRNNGGWIHRKYNYFSWALSCLQLRQFYGQLELITDELGKYILIDILRLPYTQVTVELNTLDRYDASLWALGKIYSYSIQEGPFLHVDSDIYIWQPFQLRITNANLAAQNTEPIVNNYQKTLNDMIGSFRYIPPYLRSLPNKGPMFCSNAGILGGINTRFFKTYTAEIFSFLDNNADSIRDATRRMNVTYVNVIYEQLFFYVLSAIHGQEITYLFPQAPEHPEGISHFYAADKNFGYVHCMGVEKKNRMCYLSLGARLRNLYPEYYYRIMDCVNTMEI